MMDCNQSNDARFGHDNRSISNERRIDWLRIATFITSLNIQFWYHKANIHILVYQQSKGIPVNFITQRSNQIVSLNISFHITSFWHRRHFCMSLETDVQYYIVNIVIWHFEIENWISNFVCFCVIITLNSLCNNWGICEFRWWAMSFEMGSTWLEHRIFHVKLKY